MFAIIETGGKQYKIAEGDSLRVEKLEGEMNSTLEIDKVLLVADGENINVGNPYVKNVSITTTKINDIKNKKLITYKYKRRKDFDKKKGHRQTVSILRIEKINIK